MARRKGRSSTITADQPALPDRLACGLKEMLGDQFDALSNALDLPAPVSIRLNPLKGFEVPGDQVPWCATGRYLKDRPSFTFDPLFHAGAYYVQEASSMFVEQALIAAGISDRDVVALDLCAAPGGKTTHLRSLLTPGSLLVANEVDRKRQPALQENLWKWGYPNVMVTASAIGDLRGLPEFFDLVLVDAPCSGEGMMRKDPFARQQWSTELVQHCASMQQQILEMAWHSLAPGGVIIYSTCTWETVENEDRIDRLIGYGAEPIHIPIDAEWGIVPSEDRQTGHRFYPHRTRGEGFFLSAVKKPGDLRARRKLGSGATTTTPPAFLTDPDRYHLIDLKEMQYALDRHWRNEATTISGSLRTLAPGIPVSELKGSVHRPHPALALNPMIGTTGFADIELELEGAIAYLKGHALPAKGDRGTARATYAGFPLGWLHGVGDRWNNRYPAAWRIRSHVPGPPVNWADR